MVVYSLWVVPALFTTDTEYSYIEKGSKPLSEIEIGNGYKTILSMVYTKHEEE